MNEKRINDLWNSVLFEAKVVRDHFMEECLVGAKKFPNLEFFNSFYFVGKFMPIMQSRYSWDGEDLKLPAIIYFFRSKLLVDTFNGTYGETLNEQYPLQSNMHEWLHKNPKADDR